MRGTLPCAFGLALVACREPSERAQPRTASPQAELITANTVRLTGPTPYAAATAVTQATYGAMNAEDRPHAVALVRIDRPADAMLAASRITHFPVNAPVLYVDADRMPPETEAELLRLDPDGNTYDSGVQVYLVGPVRDPVRRRIEHLGYEVRSFDIADPFVLAEALDRWAASVHADHPDEVVIVQHRDLFTGLPAVAWNAHMGHGLLFVDGDTVPAATRRALSRRFDGEAFVYLMGDETIISAGVARILASYGHVQRIKGSTPEDISVTFAGYRDAGLDQGYWIRSSTRDFGWGIAEAGHNVTFATTSQWPVAVTGSLLSHLGKHGPMIVLSETIAATTRRYLESVRPEVRPVHDALYNHGWILGSTAGISWETQAELDLLLGM